MVRNTKTSKNLTLDEAPTTLLHIPGIIATVRCAQHDAGFNTPCYKFESAEGPGVHTGICNARARAAGMNGEISPSSLEGRPQSTNSRRYA
jgi:hypothetical protein